MKVLLLHNEYQQKGGEDTVFSAEAAMLNQNGHTVETLLFSNHAIQKDFRSKFLYGIQAAYNSASYQKAFKAIQQFKPDIMHVHNLFPVASPAVLQAAKQCHVPVVMTLHNYRMICPNAMLYTQNQLCHRCVQSTIPWPGILQGCYRHSKLETAVVAWMNTSHRWLKTWRKSVARYIALTQFARQQFLQSSLELTEAQIVVKPNFVFAPPTPSEQQDQQDAERQDFIYVGRLSEEKGITTLLQAFQALPHCRLNIMGTGPLEAVVQAVAQEFKNITFMGFQEKPAILQALQTAKALILPSLWYEGFPMVVLEAFSVGCPVIATNLGSLAEIITHNQTGLHFGSVQHTQDVEDLRQQVLRLASSPVLQQQLSQNARQTYLTHYTPEQNYAQLIRIYDEVIAETIGAKTIREAS